MKKEKEKHERLAVSGFWCCAKHKKRRRSLL